MNVLSLFDGMACGRVALERAGVPVDSYFASEIDKWAIQIARKNWPEIVHLGDVTSVREMCEIGAMPEIDLLIGGSPCQGFSQAGKGGGFDDPRSKLFWEYVAVKDILKPRWFLLENVRMKREWLSVITGALGVDPVFINSADFSAQNRQRYYWTNIPVEEWEPTNTILADILEDNSGFVDRDKSYAIDANYAKGATLRQYMDKGRRQIVFKQIPRGFNKGFEKPVSKSPALGSSSWQNNNFVSQKENYFRKLTPVECERLQTLPDNYTEGVSNTQRYKMLGNGWTVDVIAHIFKGLPR